MAATLKISLGVGGYSIPDPEVLKEITAKKAVVSFTEGRRGDAVGRASDGRVILPSRRGLRVYPGEVWEGRMWLHRSGRYYIFEPERCIEANTKARDVPEYTTIYVNNRPAITLARINDASGKPAVILVTFKDNATGHHIAVYLEAIARAAKRFRIVKGTLTYREVMERIMNFKELHGASAVCYDSAKLQRLFKGIPERKSLKFAHDHRVVRDTFVQRDRDGKAFRISRCVICGKWTLSELQRGTEIDARLGLKKQVKQGSRFAPRRHAVRRWERPFWSTKGMHRRSVAHTRKSHRTRAQMKRRTRRTTQRHGTPAMWQSRRRW